jgi:hypothetical protein
VGLNMYLLDGKQPVKIEDTTFSDIGWKESDIEDVLRKNIDMVCDDEESLLIVGQQVKDETNKRSDLTAVDNDGNIVLIEIKRDKKDIAARKEALEFQAIRYAASCATIKSTDELIKNIFAPYVEKHKGEFADHTDLTSTEIAQRELSDFFEKNGTTSFNDSQRIILVAGDFDEQTLSAVAWLNSNQVDISCYRLWPSKLGSQIIIQTEKILPVTDYDDFYVDIAGNSSMTKGSKKDISRRTLPKIDKLMEWGIVKEGDVLIAKGTDEKAVLQKDGQVMLPDNTKESIQQWLKHVYGWSSVETYAFAVDEKTGKTLSELRRDYLEEKVSDNSDI